MAEETAAAKLSRLDALQGKLDDAVRGEDYAAAARLRDEVAALQLDEEMGVLAANAEFYVAFSQRDQNMMERVWSADASVSCLHPGFPPLHGSEAVHDSWRQIFSGSEMRVRPDDLRCMLLPGQRAAVVTCVERVVAENGSSGGNALAATNLFVKDGDERWRMALHQAGPLVTGGTSADDDEDDGGTTVFEIEL